MSRGKVLLHYLIIFIVMFVVMSMITMSLFIEKGSARVINDYKKELKTEVTLSSISQEVHQSEVTVNDAEKLNRSKYIKNYNYEKILNAASSTLKPVDTRLCFPRVRLSDSEDAPFLLAGYSSMTLTQDFNQKEYKLVEGRLLNSDDENTSNTVISYSLAKANNLKLGDTIKLNVRDHETTLTVVGIYKNKAGVMSHLKPYNTLFISLTKAMALNQSSQSLSSVTYYLNSEKDVKKFIKQSKNKQIDWNKLQLKSNDAQYDACVSIFENINSKMHEVYWLTLVVGSVIILFIYYLGLSKLNIYKTGCIFLLVLILTFITSPIVSRYTVNTYLSANDMNMTEKANKKIKTVYTTEIVSKTVLIASTLYLETVVMTLIYNKKTA